MPEAPGRDQVPAMERLVRVITLLNGSESGVAVGRLLHALMTPDASDGARHKMLDRDIGHLNGLGYDIRNVAPPGSDAIYRMFARDNRLRVHLTPDQQAQMLRAVLASNRHDLAAHLATDPAPARGSRTSEGPRAQLHKALRAAARRCVIRFDYKGQRRIVHPVRVHSGPSGWYLSGREAEQDIVKEFVVSRMDDVSLDEPGSADGVERQERPSMDPLSWPVDAVTDVVLAFDGEHLPLVANVLGAPSDLQRSGSHIEARYQVTHRAVFRWRVYELGTRVSLVSPDDMRAEMRTELQAIVDGRP